MTASLVAIGIGVLVMSTITLLRYWPPADDELPESAHLADPPAEQPVNEPANRDDSAGTDDAAGGDPLTPPAASGQSPPSPASAAQVAGGPARAATAAAPRRPADAPAPEPTTAVVCGPSHAPPLRAIYPEYEITGVNDITLPIPERGYASAWCAAQALAAHLSADGWHVHAWAETFAEAYLVHRDFPDHSVVGQQIHLMLRHEPRGWTWEQEAHAQFACLNGVDQTDPRRCV